ncbi:hypothetical protein DRN93_04205 [archaeon]|nr:MAG: hypothetical protein DRN93_04205 [archaeon]
MLSHLHVEVPSELYRRFRSQFPVKGELAKMLRGFVKYAADNPDDAKELLAPYIEEVENEMGRADREADRGDE